MDQRESAAASHKTWPVTVVVCWEDGVANEWSRAVTGDSDEVEAGLRMLRAKGRDENHFWMTWLEVDTSELTITPTETIEEFLARDWE